MAADDYLNTPAGQGIPDLDSNQSLSGNRPASGARRATPGEVLSQGFQGAQNAGDFLGLDTEFTASQDPNQVFGASSPLDLVPPPSTYVDDGSQHDPQQVDPGLPAVDPAQDFAEAPSAFEFGEDLGSDEGEAALDEEGAPSRRPLLLVKALLVAALAGGGMYYGSSLYSRFFGTAAEVAVAPAPVSKKGTPGADGQPSASDAPVADAASKPGTDSASAKDLPPVTAPAPSSAKDTRKPALASRPSTTQTPGPSGARSTEPEANAEVKPENVASLPSASGAPRTLTAGFPDLGSAEYAWASPDQLEMIWRGSEVPLEAVQAPAKTLMPRIGNVRVFTTGGDVFDGRLYAVGQNRVWLDAEPGRIGLDGDRVEKIEVLGPPANGTQTEGTKAAPEAGKTRVRVRVPGGMLYGSVLKAEGDEVILAMDDGGRVRVKASDIEELGSGRAVVVRR